MNKKQTSHGNFALEEDGSSHPLPDSQPTKDTIARKSRQRRVNPLPISVKAVNVTDDGTIRACCVLNDRDVVSIYLSANYGDWSVIDSSNTLHIAMSKVFKMRNGPAKLVARFADIDDLALPTIRKPELKPITDTAI